MRHLLWQCLFATGTWHVWRFAHRRTVIILTVHGVMGRMPGTASPDTAWHPLRERLSPQRLDLSLGILARYYRFVSLDAAVDMLRGRRPIEPYSIVLTFDDGYRNHVSQALPVLRRHGVPGIVFVSTGHAESRRPFWFDRIDYALQRAVTCRELSVGGQRLRLDRTSRDTLAASYAALRRESKAVERDDRDMNAELDAMAEQLEAEGRARLADVFEADEWTATLRPDELRAAAAELAFGSHSVDHLRMHRIPPDMVADQAVRSKRALEEWTGRACRAFCYPDGGVSQEAADGIRAAGYDSAVTTRRGLNRPGDDPMMLRRMDVPADGGRERLLASVSGFTDWVGHLLGRRGGSLP